MASQLLLHSKTQEEVDLFLSQPFHFLIISGPNGAGKKTLAEYIAAQIMGDDVSHGSNPNLLQISRPEGKKDIPIETLRQLGKSLKLKSTESRVVFIENGQYLNQEGQNSLLKSLEEPPERTTFIVSVDSASNLLPTIVSRAQVLEVNPVNLAQAKEFFNDKQDSAISSAWALSEGNASLLASLLGDDSSNPTRQSVEQAKRFLKLNKYEKLSSSEFHKIGREELAMFLEGLKRVVRALQRSNIEKSQTRFIAARKLIAELEFSLEFNVSPRLIYLQLVHKLKL